MKRSREPEEDYGPSSATEQDVAIIPVSKFVGLDIDNSQSDFNPEIKCSLPGHGPGLCFVTYQDYESHYHKAHSNRCLDCRKNFPSSHILNLHIKEFHDALTELRKEKGEHIYSCLVETCAEKRETPAARRAHLIEMHKYPNNYFFAVTKAGVDHRQSMLVHRNEGKPRANQRNNSRHNGQKAGKKHTGKDARPDKMDCSDVQITAPSDEVISGSAEQPADVSMGGSDDSHSQEQRNDSHDANISKDSTTGANKSAGVATSRGASASQSDQQVGVSREAAVQDKDIDNLTGALSSLKFVPRNLRLGSKKDGRTPR
ncbi:hypothetical protein Daus18300_005925 [Diaporthe australafricana]|uniref:C2H2-type domain-containing protein n=1 Tax=Diaporthe australafricana TaxID=127596 RepID=A0ABR3WXU0_9PEZI